MAAIVTLEEMKAWLKVQYDEEDALIESLILKAQAAAEDFCRTEFGEDNAPEPFRPSTVAPVSTFSAPPMTSVSPPSAK